MIKKTFIYVLFFYSINNIIYGSQPSGLFLETRIQETMQAIHEKVITENLEYIAQAYEPLSVLCNYLTGIPTTANFKTIHIVFEHLKNQVHDLNQNQPFNKRSALQIQADYCKLLYACFELHNQDIKKRSFPLQKVIDHTIADFHDYLSLHTNSFHQTFPGLIDYTLLQDSITTFCKKIVDPDVHMYIPLKTKNVMDALQKLQQAINTVASVREEEQINIDLAKNDICNVFNQLIEMKNYLTSKEFFGTLSLIHHSFNNDLNKNLGLMVEKNDQFKTMLQYTTEFGSKLLKDCIIKPCVTIKNIVGHRNDYYEIYKKKIILNYIIKPLYSYQLPNSIAPKDKAWYDGRGKIEEEVKKELFIKPIEAGKNYLAQTMHTMGNAKNDLQIDLDKNFFNPDILEKTVAHFFLKLPIHDQNNISLSWINIIFLPHIVMLKNQHVSNAYFIKSNLNKILAQLTNKEFFTNFIKNFKANYRNEFSKKLALFTSILSETLSINLYEYVFKNEYTFIFNKKFYEALDDHFSQTKTGLIDRLGDVALKKITIYEQIVTLEKSIKDLLKKNEPSSLFEKISAALDDFLYVRELLFLDNQQQLNVLHNQMEALKQKELKYYTLFNEIECLQNAINK